MITKIWSEFTSTRVIINTVCMIKTFTVISYTVEQAYIQLDLKTIQNGVCYLNETLVV